MARDKTEPVCRSALALSATSIAQTTAPQSARERETTERAHTLLVTSSALHTSGCRSFDRARSGAEWWVQLRDPAGPRPGVGPHWDKDENLRRDFAVTREAQDELAVRSHDRAVAAQKAGRFDDEIVPVSVPQRKADDLIIDTDEHPRPGSTVEKLAGLRAIMGRQDPEATVTAGNASGQNDGAAVCLVTSRETADRLGLRPLVRLVSWAVAGVRPSHMGLGPVPATAKALERAGLTLADMDLIELNEAFAAQVLAVTKEWGLADADWDRTNVNGSGISLGHPIGATGARILATLTREMDRREVRYGLETMCIGGGQGLAAVLERIDA